MRAQIVLVLSFLTGVSASADALRFSGGLCNSQGTWLQQALSQSGLIVDAINNLKDDPNCTALVKAIENTPDIKAMTSGNRDDSSSANMAMMWRDLSAVSSYMHPEKNGMNIPNDEFQKIVQYLVFRKSFDAIEDVKSRGYVANMSEEQKGTVMALSERLSSFLTNSKKIANASIATTKNILSALPQSQLCFDHRPNEVSAILGGVVGTVAALATNGEVNDVSGLIGSLLRYNRDAHYFEKMAKVEIERFRASVSCLIESTSENYCALVDGAENLKFLRTQVTTDPSTPTLQEQIISNPAANKTVFPMLGLNILMRDAPVVTDWMQRILFGIDPKLDLEGQMKNNNWDSFVANIKKDNSLRSIFRDKQSFYLTNTRNDSNTTKMAQVKDIVETLLEEMKIGTPGNGGSSYNQRGINFYAAFRGSNQMGWYLLGLDTPPPGADKMNWWDASWTNWINSGELGDADALLERIGQRLNTVTTEANRKATSFINARMIVDPMNLITEATKGPGVSPYEALLNIKAYNQALVQKFGASIKSYEGNPRMQAQARALKSVLPLLQDTNQAIDRILTALSQIEELMSKDSRDARVEATKKIMDIIYDSANMMLSRDSFFDTRLRQIVQYDISDTLFYISAQKDAKMTVELENLFSRGAAIVNTLSAVYSADPVVQSLDIAQAMEVQKANLSATEGLFSHILMEQIADIDCRLMGTFCDLSKVDQARKNMPAKNFVQKAWNWVMPPPPSAFVADDDPSLHQLRGKLCMQTLAFENRENFRTICAGAKLTSEYAGEKDPKKLNMSYDDVLADIVNLKSATNDSLKFTRQRNAGVCAFRNYLRRNYVYRMYMDYRQGQ